MPDMEKIIVYNEEEKDIYGGHPIKNIMNLVRCKDCKHRYDNDQKCPYCNECNRREYPPDDWFCADGERLEKTD